MQLHSSARYGDLAEVSRRLRKYSHQDVNRLFHGESPLMAAAGSRHAGVDMLELLLSKDADANLVGDGDPRQTALMAAARSGSLDKVRYLVDHGADPLLSADHRFTVNTALGAAANCPSPSRYEIAAFLLPLGYTLGAQIKALERALLVADEHFDFEMMKLISTSGKPIRPYCWNELMEAIAFGTVEHIDALLDEGVDPNEVTRRELTPWQLSLQVGDMAKIERLLERGAELTEDDLLYAVVRDNADVVRWLMGWGMNVNATASGEETVLHRAAAHGSTECVRLLLEARAKIHAVRHNNAQPINDAANPEIVRLLVERGADINHLAEFELQFGVSHYFDGTRLLMAAIENDVEMAKQLLALKANVNLDRYFSYLPPLHVAVRNDDLEMARLLLDAGADSCHESLAGPPILFAQSIEMVQLLMDAGADPYDKNEFEENAFDLQEDPEVAAFMNTYVPNKANLPKRRKL